MSTRKDFFSNAVVVERVTDKKRCWFEWCDYRAYFKVHHESSLIRLTCGRHLPTTIRWALGGKT